MNLIERAVTLITPSDCLFCGEEGRTICLSCQNDVLNPVPSRCVVCKVSTKNYSTCNKCRRSFPIKQVYVASKYSEKAKKLEYTMKISCLREVVGAIADLLDDTAPYYHDFCVVPVPTSPAHVRQRSFDHSLLIASGFASKRKLQFEPLLIRFDKSKQVGKSRKDRLTQLKDLFVINKKANIPKNIVLVDDVVTTGATLAESARTLKRAGARNIYALVFAQGG